MLAIDCDGIREPLNKSFRDRVSTCSALPWRDCLQRPAWRSANAFVEAAADILLGLGIAPATIRTER